jgi:hypothetical protein
MNAYQRNPGRLNLDLAAPADYLDLIAATADSLDPPSRNIRTRHGDRVPLQRKFTA